MRETEVMKILTTKTSERPTSTKGSELQEVPTLHFAPFRSSQFNVIQIGAETGAKTIEEITGVETIEISLQYPKRPKSRPVPEEAMRSRRRGHTRESSEQQDRLTFERYIDELMKLTPTRLDSSAVEKLLDQPQKLDEKVVKAAAGVSTPSISPDELYVRNYVNLKKSVFKDWSPEKSLLSDGKHTFGYYWKRQDWKKMASILMRVESLTE